MNTFHVLYSVQKLSVIAADYFLESKLFLSLNINHKLVNWTHKQTLSSTNPTN